MAKQFASINSKPGAWIVSPTDKGRKSIKNGKCFLENNETFEIELFNPLTVSVLANIKLNGQSISKTGLVVKPGQRVYLDCFIDDKKKFIFSTYEIDGSLESLNATQNNGLLEVFFYKEDVITLDNWQRKFDRVIVEKHYPYNPYPYNPYPYNPYPYNPYKIWCGNNYGTFDGEFTLTSTNLTNCVGTLGTVGNVGTSGVTKTSNAYYSSDINFSGDLSNNTKSFDQMNTLNSMETGRIEKGETSKQKFTEVEMDFENNYIASTVIQILPESRKPTEVKNVKINIELPKGDWSKKQIEEVKEVVQNFLWKENTNEIQKEMYKNIELIKKLGELHSAGILTDEEFSTKKTELLSKI